MRIGRRRFLKIGLAAAPAVAAGGYLRFGRYPEAAAFEGLAHFSPRAGAVLGAVVEAMLPPAADRSLAAVLEHVRRIDAYLAGTAQDEIVELRWLLRAIEHATFFFGGHVRRFTRLSLRARADVLASWKTSRIAACRLGIRSLVALVFLAHYRDRAAFAQIGYPGPVVPGFEGPPGSRARYDTLAAPPGQEPSFP